MAIKILMLTQWFEPEPSFKGLIFARELVQHGFEVEVVTGFPNYPGGKVYPGYKVKWLQREVIDGVRITRVPLYPSHSRSAFQRVLNYTSFAFSSLIYGLFAAKRPDVIYVYHPPLTTGITAGLIRFFRRIPVVYDMQDMWPDTLQATGMVSSTFVLDFVGRVCDWVYSHVDRIVVLSPGFKSLLISRGVTEDRISIIYNWCDDQSMNQPTGVLPVGFPGKDKFRILFAGNMGKAQALDSVLDAAGILAKQEPKICFVFVGAGVEVDQLKKKAEKESLTNVIFLPPVPRSEVGNLLNEADVLLVHLRSNPLFKITIPSKTQAYMAVGKPILMAVDGDAASLIEGANCGIVAEPENPLAIAEAAKTIFHQPVQKRMQMAENGQLYYNRVLSFKVGVLEFSKIFRQFNNT